MLGKLAYRNVKRQASSYIVYFITVVFTVALMFAVNNIFYSKELLAISPDNPEYMRGMLTIFIVIVTFVVGFIICYATAFLMRKRKKELGTYMLLGVKRFDILKMFAVENLIIGAASFVAGCVAGLWLFQILSAIVRGVMGHNFPPLSYNFESVWLTFGQWAGIFLAAIGYCGIILGRSKIADFMKDKPENKTLVKNKKARKAMLAVTIAVMAGAAVYLAAFFNRIINIPFGDAGRPDTMMVFFAPPVAVAVFFAGLIAMPKKPRAEKVIAFCMLGAVIASAAAALWAFIEYLNWEPVNEQISEDILFALISMSLAVLVLSIFTFHLTARSFYASKPDSAKKLKGANSFHYRQMTASLSRNAVIMGMIAVLLSISIIFSNSMFSIRYASIENINREMMFDVICKYSDSGGWRGDKDEMLADARSYTGITFLHEIGLYGEAETTYERTFYYSFLNNDTQKYELREETRQVEYDGVYRVSDVNRILKEIGEAEFSLAADELAVLGFADKEGSGSDCGRYGYNKYEAGKILAVYEQEFRFKEVRTGSSMPRLGDHLLILPDSALSDGEWKEVLMSTMLLMNTSGYLPPEFHQKYADYEWNSFFQVKDFAIDLLNTESSVAIVSALFVGVAFMFFAMALLSIKVMAEADLDRKRYGILNMLGVGAGRQRKILFRQIISFFAVPMLIPLFMTIPAVVFSVTFVKMVFGSVPPAIYWIGVTVPLVYAGVYLCYFFATYYLSVKSNIKPLGNPKIKLLNRDKK